MGYLNAFEGAGLTYDLPQGEQEPVSMRELQQSLGRQSLGNQQGMSLQEQRMIKALEEEVNQNAMARQPEQQNIRPNGKINQIALMGATNYSLVDVCNIYPFLPQCEKMTFDIGEY